MEQVLYHFVGCGCAHDDERNFETLCAVLASGEVGKYPKDGSRSIQLKIDPMRAPLKGELIEQSITCFCDIPFKELSVHTGKYGRFGVGVSRRALCNLGARPVAYVPTPSSRPDAWGHSLQKELRSLLVGIQEHLRPPAPYVKETQRTIGARKKDRDAVIDSLESMFHKEMLAYLKFYDSDLPDDHPENYLAEREWRKFLPLPLPTSLVEVVVPKAYESAIASRFPQLSQRVRTMG